MRFLLLGLAHLPTSRLYNSCAFTAKNIKLAKMLIDLGHEIFLFGARTKTGERVEDYIQSDNFHFVETHTVDDIRQDYGEGDNRFEIGYNYKNTNFKTDFNEKKNPSTLKFYDNAIKEINKMKKPDDFLLLSQGYYHKPISDEVNLFLTCEPGIGYRGSFAKFRAFESSYIQNFTYGSEHPRHSINGNYYDRVIPNSFDVDDFEIAKEKKDYYLFLGRICKRKGVVTAIKATQAINAKLIIAGQQTNEIDINKLPKHCEYIGHVDAERRKKLLSEAIAVYTPSLYLEPFCGVHIESMLSGTPPITTNFGVFPETIPYNLNFIVGFRCDVLQDFVNAAKKAVYTEPEKIRDYARRFSTKFIKFEYLEWFNQLHDVWESSIDPSKKAWHKVK